MTFFRAALTVSAAALLSACITVEPSSTAGKTAVKTAGVMQKIVPVKKPTMIIPATQRSYASDEERALACSRGGNSQTRLVVIDESGNSQSVVSDVAIDCSNYSAPLPYTRTIERAPVVAAPSQAYITTASTPSPVVTAPRMIRVAVDGGAERIYEIDDVSGTARPMAQPQPYTPAYVSAPQTYEARAQTQSYSAKSHRVRRGDTMYSLAKRYCVSLDALSSSSGVYAPYTIDPGQDLRLPSGAC